MSGKSQNPNYQTLVPAHKDFNVAGKEDSPLSPLLKTHVCGQSSTTEMRKD